MRRMLIAIMTLAAGQAMAAGKDGYMCHSRQMPEMIVFQSKPCAPGLEARETSPAVVTSGVPVANTAPAEPKRSAQSSRGSGDSFDRVKIGMASAKVVNLVGEPTRISSNNYGDGPTEQWVYETGAFLKSHYIYIRDGVVSSIQLSR